MKNFVAEQIFTMYNRDYSKAYDFAKGVDADGKEAYAIFLAGTIKNGVYHSSTKKEMLEVRRVLKKEGWEEGLTFIVADIPVGENKAAEVTSAPKEPMTKAEANRIARAELLEEGRKNGYIPKGEWKKRLDARVAELTGEKVTDEPKVEKAVKTEPKARKTTKTAKTTAAPKDPKTKVKAPSKWLFPKKVGRKTTWSADNFDYELYKKIAEELGVWNEAKGKVNSTDREKVYEAMGAKLNPEWVAWNEKNGGRKNG